MSTIPLRGGQARQDELLNATLDVLTETGYDRLTIDAVVARARASKTTLYRRWPSKSALVIAAFTNAIKEIPAEPDTGSLRGDLIAILDGLVIEIGRLGDVMAGLISASRRDAELSEALRTGFVEARREMTMDVFRRARERGEIPADLDLDLIWHLAPAMVFFRALLIGDRVDHGLVRRLVDEVVLPLVRPHER